MDPLSVSASIAGLVTLADGVFRKTYQYSKGVNDAKQEVQDLSKKVRDLAGILHNLSITVSALDDHTFDPSLRMHHINSCRQSLMQLDTVLSKAQNDFDAPSKLKSIQRRLKWPLSTAKTKQIIEDIRRHHETIDLALSADSMSAILQCLSRHQALAGKVDGIGLDIKRALTINTRIEMNSKRQAVLDFFAPVNPQHNFEMSLRLRHPLTGLWLTEGSIFQSWLHSHSEEGPKSARLWLSGIPGAGKTVLAGSIIEEALGEMRENDAVAFFFCDYKNAQSLIPTNILGTLAAQLAKQDDKAFDNLQEYYKELHPARHFSKTPTTQRLNQVLQLMAENFNRVFIIVDGLDECRDEVDSVVEELHSFAISGLPIKTALLSRDEQIIRMRFEDDFSHIEIAAHREDLQLYVAAEIDARVQARKLRLKSMSFKDEVIEAIVSKSEGMFRWAVCQIDYLCELPSDRARKEALAHLPPTLNATYERILERINEGNEQSRVLVQKVLQLIAWGEKNVPLNNSQLCEAISIIEEATSIEPDDIIEIEEVTLRCGSLVRQSNIGDYLEFAHFSVREFLEGGSVTTSHKFSDYCISGDKGSDLIAEAGLRILTLPQFSKPFSKSKEQLEKLKERNKTYPFYSFASLYLPAVLTSRQFEKPKILEMAKLLFDPSKTYNFLAWSANICCFLLREEPFGPLRRARFSYETSSSSLSSCSSRSTVKSSSESDAEGSDSEFKHGNSFLSASEVLLSLFRTDFTTLHLAASLGFLPICRHLIGHGVDVNTRSNFGTPLQAALAGPTVFSGYDVMEDVILCDRKDICYYKYDSRIPILEMLIEAGARSMEQIRTKSWRHHFSYVAFRLAYRYESWMIFSYLLSQGMPIDDETLNECETALSGRYGESDIKGFVEAVLQSTEITQSTDPQSARLYSLAWDLGVEFEISSIINHNRTQTGSFLDMTDESFFDALTLAIKDDNVEYLQRSFVDTRLERYQQAHMDHYTLLHVAASENSVQCLKILLERGYDPSLKNKDGQLPIHACSIDDNEDALRVFIEHHVQIDSKDVDAGASIWHHAAHYNSLQILRVLVKLAPQERLEALKATSKLGLTPLSTALWAGAESAALLLLEYCTEEACFRSPVDLYQFAARIGSEILVNRLSDAGVKPQLEPSGNRTPLHGISRRCTLSCLKRICSLYPNDSMKLCNGNTAVEEYMLREMIYEGDHADIICELIHNNGESPDREKLAKIWETFVSTQVLGRNLMARSPEIARQDALDVLELLMEEGVMSAYEEERKISGLKPLVESISQLIWPDTSPSSTQSMVKKPLALPESLTGVSSHPLSYSSARFVASSQWRSAREPQQLVTKKVKRPPVTLPYLPPPQSTLHREQFLLASRSTDEVILRIIQRAQYLDTVNNGPDISRLLKLGIRNNSKKLCRELLRIGVPVHSDEEESPVMRACSVTSKCDGELFEEILQYADKDKLDDISLGTTRSCILLLGQPGVTDGTRKLEALVKAGANPNQVTQDDLRRPALVDYLLSWRDNSKMSAALLHLGANPLLKSTTHYDASLAASLGGHEGFLKSLLEYQASTGVNIQWTGRASAFISHTKEAVPDCSALHLAALGNKVGCALFYLDKKLITDVDIEAANGVTPLHLAAYEGRTEMVQFLLDQGANINARTFSNMRPIDMAIRRGRTIVVEILAQKGAGNTPLRGPQSTTSPNSIENPAPGFSRHPSQFPVQAKGDQASVLEYAITQGNLKMSLDIINQGCSIETKMPSCHACTPLLHAVRLEKIEIANMLLDRGASARPIYCPRHVNLPPDYASIEGGVTATHIVCQRKNLTKPLLQQLMDRHIQGGGAWLSSLRNPLSTAIAASNYHAFLIFFMHVQNNAIAHLENDGKSAAGLTLPSDVIQMYLNETEFRTKDAWIPLLHAAVTFSSLPIIEAFINQGAEIDIRDQIRSTPLHTALKLQRIDVAKYLIDKGANVASRDDYGNAPLSMSIQNCDLETTKYLIERGANFNIKDTQGRNLLCIAAISAFNLPHNMRLFEYLLDLGIDPWELDEGGNSAVYYALSQPGLLTVILRRNLFKGAPLVNLGQLDIGTETYSKLLGALLRLRRCFPTEVLRTVVPIDSSGTSRLLCRAAQADHLLLLDCLFSLGIDIEAEGCDEGTALMAAAAFGCFSAVKWLVRRGARISYSSANGTRRSAVQLALPFPEIVAWLLSKRFMVQPKLELSPSSNESEPEFMPWSGIIQGELSLEGWCARWWEETDFMYAQRLVEIRKEWLGDSIPAKGVKLRTDLSIVATSEPANQG